MAAASRHAKKQLKLQPAALEGGAGVCIDINQRKKRLSVCRCSFSVLTKRSTLIHFQRLQAIVLVEMALKHEAATPSELTPLVCDMSTGADEEGSDLSLSRSPLHRAPAWQFWRTTSPPHRLYLLLLMSCIPFGGHFVKVLMVLLFVVHEVV